MGTPSYLLSTHGKASRGVCRWVRQYEAGKDESLKLWIWSLSSVREKDGALLMLTSRLHMPVCDTAPKNKQAGRKCDLLGLKL